jgi:hypothetical protein
MEQPVEECGRDGERWVRDDMERPARQPQRGRIGACKDEPPAGDVRREPLAERVAPTVVELDGDDACADGEQRRGDGAVAGADVEDEGSGREPRVSDELLGPPRVQPVPSPPDRGAAHGGAPS